MANTVDVHATPLPKLQLAVIYFCRIVEVISFTIHLPFIFFMVQEILDDADPKKVAYHVGYLSLTFGIAQFFSSIQWGYVSDRIGRRPVFLISTFIVIVCSLMIGLSRSYTLLFIANLITGLGKGTIGVIKSMLGEIADESNKARVFSLLPVMMFIGAAIGSFLGGILAKPAEKYPDTLGHVPLLKVYPYLLPMAVSAFLCAIGFLLTLRYVKETLPAQRSTSNDDTSREAQPLLPVMPTRSSIRVTLEMLPQFLRETRTGDGCTIIWVILSYAIYTLLFTLFDYIFLLWIAMDTKLQGLGLDTRQIGLLLMTTNVAAFIGQGFAFVPVHDRCGLLGLYRYCLLFNIPLFLSLPLLNWIMHSSIALNHATQDIPSQYWFILLALVGFRSVANAFTQTCLQIMVINAGTKISALGLVNGIANSASALAIAVGPLLAAIIWDISLTNSGLIWHGLFAWSTLVVISVSCLLFSSKLSLDGVLR